MRTHPDAGVALLSSDTISPLVKSVVRDHHERWDGSGYPRGTAGAKISHFAQIAAVATSMTPSSASGRTSQPHRPTWECR